MCQLAGDYRLTVAAAVVVEVGGCPSGRQTVVRHLDTRRSTRTAARLAIHHH